ncbi:TonB-dependent receptor [Porphyrobacter sp. GA68]|uniref:TonB-dependent receptor n=1 Tax=Porphyrobacter sp. GA68 TaxID=2883480 RepID=UPI001D187D4E|nr:TonB-dependent receptor [Porphyrobacter sp. GA68]
MLYHKIVAAASPLTLALITASQPAVAQQTAPAPGPARGDLVDDDFHNRQDAGANEIIVSARGVRELDILAGTSVIEGTELQRNLDGQIGEVLARLPGVTATGFAPGASRPVLRGFSGERVRVLNDGIGTLDASNTSDDHAVSIDPLTVERIEVLRGPAVLLYGSQAIGGAVNVIDKRIPRRVPDESIHLDALAGYDSVSDAYQIASSVDAPLGGGFVVHADGSYRKAGDVSIPGFVVSNALRADLLAEAAEEEAEGELGEAAELRAIANQRGVLPNSFAETWSANLGASFFAGGSMLGASVGWYDTSYGLPARPGAEHAHSHDHDHDHDHDGEGEEGPVTIGLRQFRADLRGELMLGNGLIEKLITRVGYSNYTHTEFEGTEVGTVFDVQGIEARAEFVQNSSGALRGSFGAQYYFRDFAAIGAEAFVAPNRTDQFGVFALQEYQLGAAQLEGAARYEVTGVDSQTLGIERDFRALSGALGLSFDTGTGLRAGVNGTRVERAPSGEELFSNGPHVATQAFEIGDPDLSKERAWGVEGYVRGRLGPAQVNLALYRNWFDDYIYLSETGEEEDGLPVFVYLQDDANYFGVEGQVTVPFYRTERLTLLADLRGDYVRAELTDGTPLPRIPPLRLLGALEAQGARFDARAEVQWFSAQNRTAPFELPTDDYMFVNASLAFKPLRGDDNVTLLLRANNIFDVEGRRHTSFTKEFVPLPGRNLSASVRLSF